MTTGCCAGAGGARRNIPTANNAPMTIPCFMAIPPSDAYSFY
jgi:hypothetical protein